MSKPESYLVQFLIVPMRVDAFEVLGQPIVLANKQEVQRPQGRLFIHTQITFK